MDPSLGLLVEGMTLAKSIAELFGVLETIDSKVDRLMESELKTGMLELQQAAISNTESVELLRSARQRFNKAITLESGYKQCLSYVGAAVCHYHLNDHQNARKALENAIAIETDINTKEWFLTSLTDGYSPLDMFDGKKLKQSLSDSLDFRKNIKGPIGFLKKEVAIGKKTERILEDQKKLIALQEIAAAELKEMSQL